jgi:hypothetical protein
MPLAWTAMERLPRRRILNLAAGAAAHRVELESYRLRGGTAFLDMRRRNAG